MIKVGLAEVYRGKPAAGLNLDLYWRVESEAKQARRNMWSLGDKYVFTEGLAKEPTTINDI